MAEKENQQREVPQKLPIDSPSALHEGDIVYTPGKSEWPEVVGLTAEEAVSKIKEETPAGTHVHVVRHDSFVTMDFRLDRVRIFIASTGKVHKPPRIG